MTEKCMTVLRPFFVALAGLFLLGFLCGGHALAAPEFTMKLGHATANDCQDEVGKVFAAEVERLSNGRIKAPVYNASQLGNNEKMNKDVRSGAQEALIQPTGFCVPYIPLLGVLDLPFLFPNDEVYAKVINTEASDPFRKAARKANVEIVAFVEIAFKYFATRFPIDKPEDLKGRKIRVLQSPVLLDTFKAFGAIGVPMPLGEVYTGLQQGVVDGFDAPVDLIERMKFHEVAKYITGSYHGGNVIIVQVNKGWLDSLPKDLQDAVHKAGLSAAGTKAMMIQRDFEQKSLEIVKKAAVYREMSQDERGKMNAATQSVWEDVKKDSEKAEALNALVKGMESIKK